MVEYLFIRIMFAGFFVDETLLKSKTELMPFMLPVLFAECRRENWSRRLFDTQDERWLPNDRSWIGLLLFSPFFCS